MMNELLSLHEISFSWIKQVNPILNITHLQLAKGQSMFLQGASGSGKSTLLNLIAGVLLPQQGTIKVLGKDLRELSGGERDRFRAEHMGVIFQLFNLLPYLSVLDNVLLALNFAPQRRLKLGTQAVAEAKRLLEHLGLGKDFWHRPVSQLSIGQQQRVAGARALLGHPPLLLADEPTSALDSDSKTAFLELILAEAKEHHMGIVFVSHDRSLKPLFDHSIDISAFNQNLFTTGTKKGWEC